MVGLTQTPHFPFSPEHPSKGSPDELLSQRIFLQETDRDVSLSHGLTMSIILQFAEVNLLGKSVKKQNLKTPRVLFPGSF